MKMQYKQKGMSFAAVLLAVFVTVLLATVFWMTASMTTGSNSETNVPADSEATSATHSQLTNNSFAVNGVRVFDGERTHENQVVIVRDGLIDQVGVALDIPNDMETIDGQGKTLLPGFIDSHVHTFLNAQQDALRFGVTTAIDLFSDHQLLAGYKDLRERINQQDQADVYSAGSLITAPGGHGTQFGMSIPTLSAAVDADAFVAARQAEGSDFIKVVYENGGGFGNDIPTLNRETLIAVIAAAKDRGLLTIVHISTLEFAKQALEAGADGLAHVFSDQPADQAFIDLAKQKDAFIVPTLAVLGGFSGQSQINRWLQRPVVAQQLSQMQRDNLNNAFPFTQEQAANNAAISIERMHAAGIRLLAGSDAPNPGTAHGIGLHQELWWLVAAGLTPAQALQAATANAADVFGLTDRGRISPGLRADLILVNGDPLSDIDDTLNIDAIWKDGFSVARGVDNAAQFQAEASEQAAELMSAGVMDAFDTAIRTDRWQISTDQMMGGKSEALMERVSDAQQAGNYYLHVSGEIMPGSMFPWAGVITFSADVPMQPVDASKINRLQFRAKGLPGSYQLMVFSGPQTSAIPVMHSLSLTNEWQQFDVDLQAMAGVELSLLRGFAWTAGSGQSGFEFDLDDIKVQ